MGNLIGFRFSTSDTLYLRVCGGWRCIAIEDIRQRIDFCIHTEDWSYPSEVVKLGLYFADFLCTSIVELQYKKLVYRSLFQNNRDHFEVHY